MPSEIGILEEFAHFRPNIVGTHKRFADQEGMHAARPHKFHIRLACNAAFGNDGFAFQRGQQRQGLVEETSKVRRLRLFTPATAWSGCGIFQFGFVVQLEQDGHAQFVRQRLKAFQLSLFQCGGNQQDGIRPHARA